MELNFKEDRRKGGKRGLKTTMKRNWEKDTLSGRKGRRGKRKEKSGEGYRERRRRLGRGKKERRRGQGKKREGEKEGEGVTKRQRSDLENST